MTERRRATAEPESPVETPEPPTPAEEEETPEEDVPEPTVPGEEEPEPAQAVEPLLGLEEYVSVAGLSTPAQAALKRWLQVTRHDMYGHHPLAQWQEYHQAMLAHTG